MKLRTLLFWPHLIAGVLAGAVILLMSITGVVLMYERQIVAWAESTDDLAAVRDAADRWGAITEYVRRTSREGVAEAEAALRRLEVRIGRLLGPHPGHGVWFESIIPDETDSTWYAYYHHELPAYVCGRPEQSIPRIGAAMSCRIPLQVPRASSIQPASM